MCTCVQRTLQGRVYNTRMWLDRLHNYWQNVVSFITMVRYEHSRIINCRSKYTYLQRSAIVYLPCKG